jgi:molecular chaperone DnaJ
VADRDLYEVLGVARDATQDEIKRAYRRLARQHHPDVSGEPHDEHRIKEINLAYQTLSDPEKRRRYDVFGGEGLTPDMFGMMGDIGDLFEAFFGSPFGRGRDRTARTRVRRGGDLHAILELSFEEAAFGRRHQVEVESLERCERCGGAGAEPGTHPSRCSVCGGTGELSDVRRSVFGTVMTARPCARCQGTGQEIANPCRECRGDGRVSTVQKVDVEVPAGVSDGMELRVEGAGEDGRQGGPAGDLYLTLRVHPHPVFRRQGQDLVCALDVPITTALLGGEVEIPTLDGTEVLRIAPGTRAGQVLRLPGKGVPHLGRRRRGDLLVRVDLEVPPRLSRRERAVVEELARQRGEDASGPVPGRVRPLP